MNDSELHSGGFADHPREAFLYLDEPFRVLSPHFDGPTWRNLERRNIRKAVWLWAATLFSCTISGYFWDAEFQYQSTGVNPVNDVFQNPLALLRGMPFAIAILLILGSHEMGHFLACRKYGMWCTPPFALPLPLPFLPSFGTLGAFIKIKQPFLDRRRIFDVGVAGPLAGFVAAIPVFTAGVLFSRLAVPPPPAPGAGGEGEFLYFGESLLTYLGFSLKFTGGFIAAHPFYWAAFFGFLATSLNLLPVGQLDGGHIVYAVFGRRVHRWTSWATFAALVGISLLSWPSMGYLPFALVLILLRVHRHPPPLIETGLLGRKRVLLALAALLVFALTFIPVPVTIE